MPSFFTLQILSSMNFRIFNSETTKQNVTESDVKAASKTLSEYVLFYGPVLCDHSFFIMNPITTFVMLSLSCDQQHQLCCFTAIYKSSPVGLDVHFKIMPEVVGHSGNFCLLFYIVNSDILLFSHTI